MQVETVHLVGFDGYASGGELHYYAEKRMQARHARTRMRTRAHAHAHARARARAHAHARATRALPTRARAHTQGCTCAITHKGVYAHSCQDRADAHVRNLVPSCTHAYAKATCEQMLETLKIRLPAGT
eukprot:6192857-Pleurochrysis_carterae.AAC.4